MLKISSFSIVFLYLLDYASDSVKIMILYEEVYFGGTLFCSIVVLW